MSDSGGTIRTLWVFDASQGVQASTQIRASFQGVQAAGDANVKTFAQMEAELKAMSAAMGQAGAQTKQAGATSLQTAQAEARLALTLGDRKRAIEILENALVGQQQRTTAVINAETQLTQIENQGVAAAQKLAAAQQQSAQTTSLAGQVTGSLKSNLLGILGPAALVTAGFGAIKGAINLTEESFKLKAALDTTNLSIQLQLKNFRDVNQTLADGRQFAERYKITQEENAAAIQASIPLLRQSHASLSDVEAVLSRLAVLKPSQGIQGAAFALAELEGGQARSLATRFNIPIAQATELKNKIKEGGDAVQVMDAYLNSVGIDMSTLDTRTQGATGKMNALAVETERFKLALGGQAGGPGLALLEARIQSTRGATRLLSGDFVDVGKSFVASVADIPRGLSPILDSFRTAAVSVQSLTSYQQLGEEAQRRSTAALQAAVAAGERKSAVDDQMRTGLINLTNALSEEEQEKLADKITTAELATQQKQLEADSYAAAQGLLGAGNQAELLAQKYGIAKEQAEFLIRAQQKLGIEAGLADHRLGERDLNTNLNADQAAKFGKIAHQGEIERQNEAKKIADKAAADAKQKADKAAQDADKLADLRLQGRLTNAKTAAQKIAVLNEQLAKTTDPIERQQLQNQIDQERISAGKAINTGLDKTLSLNERIYDSVNKQKDALLDIEELTIKDRQSDREDAAKARTANAILSRLGGRTDSRSLDLAARARDSLALIDVQDRKRAQDIAEKQATVGGNIVNGRVLQSQGGGGGAPPQAGGGSGTPTGGGGAPPAGAGAAGTFTVNVIIDGKTAWSGISPYAWDDFIKGVRNVGAG